MRGFRIRCLSHLRWDFVHQRPQHLLIRAARERRVFYVEEALFDASKPRLDVSEVHDNVFVCVPHLPETLRGVYEEAAQRVLLEGLVADERIADYVLWFYTPMALAWASALEPLATVYDCMDELTGFAGAPPELPQREAELLKRADLVFTGGRSLYEAKRDRHPSVYAFPSSVDPAHFAQARVLDEPDDQAPIPSPRLGFYGVLDERLDGDLLEAIADLRPEWQFVLIGPVVKIDPADLPRRPNIHYLGSREYEELPAYLAGWDVALLPFARNEATRFISPTKTAEYLAAGKAVVSTSIADVVVAYGENGLARIADEPSAFVAACDEALAEDPRALARRIEAALPHSSWDSTWARMLELIEGTVEVATDRAATPTLRLHERAFEYMIVGAGFAGSVAAERLAAAGKRVVVVDRRNHIGGNAYDHYNDGGILVHRYGPHIFHTNSAHVFAYLSRFTEWRDYEHRVLASLAGQLLPTPITLDTVNRLYALNLDPAGLQAFFERVAEPVERTLTSEDVVVSTVGRDLYEKFFRGYTRKQWGLDPSELDATVTARVPTRTSRDDRYFTDTYQAMPLHGYTRMFERMLAHPNIKVLLNTDYREVQDLVPYRELVYTGPVDEYFDFCYGTLPYRSLEFRFHTLDTAQVQPVAVVNHPNQHPYTRVTEFKHLTGQEHSRTTLVYEYPRADGDPYYP